MTDGKGMVGGDVLGTAGPATDLVTSVFQSLRRSAAVEIVPALQAQR